MVLRAGLYAKIQWHAVRSWDEMANKYQMRMDRTLIPYG